MSSEKKNVNPENPLGPLGWSLIVFVPIVLFVLVIMRLTSQHSRPASERSKGAVVETAAVQPTKPRPRQPENPNVNKDIENQLVVQMTQIAMQQMAQACHPWVEPDLSHLRSLRVRYAVSDDDSNVVHELRIQDSSVWLFTEQVVSDGSNLAAGAPFLGALGDGHVWFWEQPDSDAQLFSTVSEASLWGVLIQPVPLEILRLLVTDQGEFECLISGDAVVEQKLCFDIEVNPKKEVFVASEPPLGLRERVLGSAWVVRKIKLVIERTTSLIRELTLIGDEREMIVTFSDYGVVHGGSEAPTSVALKWRERGQDTLSIRCNYGWIEYSLWALDNAEIRWPSDNRVQMVSVKIDTDTEELASLMRRLKAPAEN